MAFKIFDFQCTKCNFTFEELVDNDDNPVCSFCGSPDTEKLFPTARLNTMNLLSQEEYKKKMLKRSSDHTTKMLKTDGYKGQAVFTPKK